MNTFPEAVYFQNCDAVDFDRNKLADQRMSIELDWERPGIKLNYRNSTKNERAHKTVKPKEEVYLG